MHKLYLFSVWAHILAATIWIGGMLFLVLVVVPWLRTGAQVEAGRFLRETGVRFRNVAWWCFGIVLVTGIFNLWTRGVRLADFVNPDWIGSRFGTAVILKLCVFALVLVISALHDFVLGPKATEAIQRAPRSSEATVLRRRASLIGRVNAMLSLVLLALGVMLVRGVPW